MSTRIQRPRRTSVKNSTDVRFSDRMFPYATWGKSGQMFGMVGFFHTPDRPPLDQVPTGTLIVNLDTGFLEISLCDPDYPPPRWLAISGTRLDLGLPTDGTYADGLLTLSGDMSIADAVDAINEQLLICCSSGIVTDFASHLGTTDGNTDGRLVSPGFSLGRVASPDSPGSPFYTGGWDNDTNRDLTDASTLTWELGGGEKVTDLHTGTITAEYSTSGVFHTETLTLDGTVNPQSSTPNGYITASLLSNHPQAAVIEGFVSVSIPLNVLLGGGSQSAKVNVDVEHEVISGTSYTQDIDFFKDGGSAPSISNQSVQPGTIIPRYLSGVQFMSTSGASHSSILFVISSLNLWEDTYRSDVLLVNSANYGVPNFTVNYNGADVYKTGVPAATPYEHDEDFVFSGSRDITLSVVNPDENGNFLTMSAQVRDPFNVTNGPAFSGVPSMLINSFPASSTDLVENFVDEDYRLNSTSGSIAGLSGSNRGVREWDSTETLVTASGLQVVNGALIYPQHDWSVYVPTPNPDYTGIPAATPSGGLSYERQYASTSARTNGVIRIEGMTEADRTNRDIIVEIRVVETHQPGNPTQGPGNLGTGWLSLNDPFNLGSFAGDDGDGCFVNTGGFSAPNFEFTLGGFSTAFSENNAVEVRVTYPNTAAGRSKRITKMEMTTW